MIYIAPTSGENQGAFAVGSLGGGKSRPKTVVRVSRKPPAQRNETETKHKKTVLLQFRFVVCEQFFFGRRRNDVKAVFVCFYSYHSEFSRAIDDRRFS